MNCKSPAGAAATMLAGVIAALPATPTIAGAAEGRWHLRLAARATDSGSSAVEVVGGGEDVAIWTNAGGGLGVDIHLGSSGHWSLVGLVRYVDTNLEATPANGDTGVIEFDPTIFGAGVAYRF